MQDTESKRGEETFAGDSTGVTKLFTRLDEIILEMLMLKKELAGKLEKTT